MSVASAVAPTFLDVKGAAQFLSLSVPLLNNLRTTGGGPKFCRPPGVRAVRYHVDDLIAWMKSAGSFTSTHATGEVR
jgi:hypothetical protein